VEIGVSRRTRVATFLLLSASLVISGLPSAFAANYTVAYDANANMVGAVTQAGITTGSLPSTVSYAQGTIVTVAAKGNLARQGFTFAGWNDRSDGTGVTYAAGTGTFTLGAGNVTLYAIWQIPTAARLIGNGGSMITVTNPNNVSNGTYCVGQGIRGITSDGTDIFYRPSGYIGYICRVTAAGVLISVNVVSGLESVAGDSNALVYGNGCLFLRKDPNTTFTSIYCVVISTWALVSIALPSSYPMPNGGPWLYGNFIQFPDGRIGSVGTSVAAASWSGGVGTGAGQCPSGMYCKSLRLYNVSGTGASVTTTYSTDFILADSYSSWPSDDHGIATDGTYLYQVRHQRGYKVWALQTTGPSYLVFNGDADTVATSPACGASTGVTGTYCQITYPVTGAIGGSTFSNGTYLGRSHGLGKYLIGDYSGSSNFWLSDAASPPPGPGNPDITPPSFTNSDTFTVAENIATTFNAAIITVNDSATLTLGAGIDGGLFNIVNVDTATAYIRFKVSPDYEGPTDVGTNNIYNFTITTTDSVGNSASRTFAIVVTNVNEVSTTSPPSVVGNVYKGVQITITVTVNAPGSVRFYLAGKRIPTCLARPTSGSYPNYTATCAWKPPVIGFQNLTAELTPSDNTFSRSTSAVGSFWVLRRTTIR
jgi:uncharacterized repeat protein (TIGR02543 family)